MKNYILIERSTGEVVGTGSTSGDIEVYETERFRVEAVEHLPQLKKSEQVGKYTRNAGADKPNPQEQLNAIWEIVLANAEVLPDRARKVAEQVYSKEIVDRIRESVKTRRN